MVEKSPDDDDPVFNSLKDEARERAVQYKAILVNGVYAFIVLSVTIKLV